MTPTGVITDRDTLRKHPPDILLTNYKMLDYLMLRPIDRGCGRTTRRPRCATWWWTSCTPSTVPRARTWPCCCADCVPA